MMPSGNLFFFGERQIQSQVPESGYAPEVSICVFRLLALKACVKGPISQVRGSPPLMTMVSEYLRALVTIWSIPVGGCISAFQLSFTSHQWQPTSQPPTRMK